MTPKEKSIELYKKYNSIKIKEVYDGIFLAFADDLCKQMALIAVDEILEICKQSLDLDHLGYWLEVKQEIEKL